MTEENQKINNERYAKGLAVMKEHLGPKAEQYVEVLRDISPEFARVNVEFAFGDLYGKGSLTPRIQELITLGALTVMGHAQPQLKLHVKSALRCGATEAEVVEVITQMLAYCGFPAATNALLTVKEAFAEYHNET